jgi:2-amino-4-hydroxy-6-hydroxymethyldihydropteridine diphosphokinase
LTSDGAAARAYVGLGGNVGDVQARLRSAFDALARIPSTRLLRRSRSYRTPPWGIADQPDFINAVAELETSLAPRELLDALLAIERAHGRQRGGERWGPRTLDLDLLAYGDLRCEEPGLTLPHPRIGERAFVLAPLAELCAEMRIPGSGTVRELLARVDAGACVPIDE